MERRQTLAALAAMTLMPVAMAQQAYPDRPIKLIVPAPPGGSADPPARIIGQKLSELLGQPVIIENRAGANTAIASGMLAKAEPDGYTLLLNGTSTHLLHAMQANVPYDTFKDFTPVAAVTRSAFALVVSPSLPSTYADFLRYAKANAGKLNYATTGNGSVNHLTAELFNAKVGIRATQIAYRGSAQSTQDLITGRVQYAVAAVSSIIGALRSNQIRPLAFTAPQSEWPSIPTFTKMGAPELETMESVLAIFGPAKMPQAVLQRLGEALRTVLGMPEVHQVLQMQGLAANFMPSESCAEFLRSEHTRFVNIIRAHNIDFTK